MLRLKRISRNLISLSAEKSCCNDMLFSAIFLNKPLVSNEMISLVDNPLSVKLMKPFHSFLFFFFFLLLHATRLLAYDIAVVNADGKTIYYSYYDNQTKLVVSCYNQTNTKDGVLGGAYTGDIVIPSTVTYNSTTYPVASIGDEAFANCSQMTSITLPSSIENICPYAFFECTGLTSIILPEGLLSIQRSAFYCCNGLTSIYLPSTLKKVERSIFYGCDHLESITIDSNNSFFDSRENCNAIIETSTNTLHEAVSISNIPSSVTAIGDYAFQSVEIESIEIPNSVKSIGNYAFANSKILHMDLKPLATMHSTTVNRYNRLKSHTLSRA